MAKKNAANVVGVKTKTTWKQAFKRDWQLYLLLLFPLIMVIVFSYGAYPGLRMAFMDYKPAKGYAGSEWVGMKTFIKIFKDADFMRALRNSVVFNLADLLVGFPMPIILALILNELRYPRFKKVSQTILYLPSAISHSGKEFLRRSLPGSSTGYSPDRSSDGTLSWLRFR